MNPATAKEIAERIKAKATGDRVAYSDNGTSVALFDKLHNDWSACWGKLISGGWAHIPNGYPLIDGKAQEFNWIEL